MPYYVTFWIPMVHLRHTEISERYVRNLDLETLNKSMQRVTHGDKVDQAVHPAVTQRNTSDAPCNDIPNSGEIQTQGRGVVFKPFLLFGNK